jgi:eukaryotic-like serine/threonine-protein kinase
VLRKVQAGTLIQPRNVQPSISPALEAICLKAIALRPEHRYAAPRELGDELEHWLADEPVRAWPEPLAVKMGR